MEFSWIQFLAGVGQFLLAGGIAFVVYCLVVSHLRFEALAEQAAQGLTPSQRAAQGAEALLTTRLAGSSRPFALIMLQPVGPAPAGDEVLAALEKSLRAGVRAADRVARCEGGCLMALADCAEQHGPGLLARLVAGAGEGTSLRGALVSYPSDRGRAAELLALARRRLDEAPAAPVGPAVAAEPPPAAAETAVQAGRLLDPLTGVLRAEHLDASLQKYLARLREAELPFALLHVDVDGMRRYNTQYGEPRGDRILKALSQFLQRRLREDDLIGRGRGGDEFVVALMADAAQAQAVGRRLVTTLRRPERDGQLDGLRVGISVGVAAWPQHGVLARHVWEAAVRATRLAKARGRGQCVLAEGPPPATLHPDEPQDKL